MLLSGMLKQLIRKGTLHVIDSSGKKHTFAGSEPGPEATIRFHNPSIELKFVFNASMALGEGYMNKSWTVEQGDLYTFLDLIGRNISTSGRPKSYALFQALQFPFRVLQQFNPLKRSRKNVAHHYDLSGRLYDLFLDPDRNYSCALYKDPCDDLETAQLNKQRLIADKLCLKPGQRVLEIGSGWGGMALFLAREYKVSVTGLTLSKEQHELSTNRAKQAGVSDRVEFLLKDYREETGTYDRIVSIGMFEHVGINHYDTFFQSLSERLKPDGVALLHTIGRMEGPTVTDPWIRKYIFPGGYLPALSEVSKSIEKTDLWLNDIEILRYHYAYTLRDWRHRFMSHVNEAADIYDRRFCRMWEYYLAISEISFRHLRNIVFQFQISNTPDSTPITRDYLIHQ